MRYAMIQNNVVINIIELEQDHAEEFASVTNSIVINIDNYKVAIGFTYINDKFYNENNEEVTYTEIEPIVLPEEPNTPIELTNEEKIATLEQQVNELTTLLGDVILGGV